MDHMNQSPVNAGKIKQWTMRDPILSQVLKFTCAGWLLKVNDGNFKPYFRRREEISV